MTNPNRNPNDREWKQEVSAANANGVPANEDSPATIKERLDATGSPLDTERDDANTDALTSAAARSGVAERGDAIPRSTVNPKPGAAPAYQTADVRDRDFAQVQAGWSVFSADGEEMGTVSRLGPNWFAVPYGTNDERTMYIPTTYLETIGNRRVVLNQPAGLLIDMKLNQPPADAPGEIERVSGTDHHAWRGENASQVIAEPAAMPAQEHTKPVVTDNDTAGPSSSTNATRASMSMSPGAMSMQSGAGTMEMRSVPSSESERLRADAALQPAEPWVDQGGARQPAVQATTSGSTVAASEGVGGAIRAQDTVSTRMTPGADTEITGTGQQVNQERRSVEQFEQRSGFITESSNFGFDQHNGPTAQAGVKDQQSYEPLRTPFGETGVPGEGKERNVGSLDLSANKHPEGSAFDSQASTVGRPIAPGEPSIANRSVPGLQGGPPQSGAPDVPPGAVSRPEPDSSR